MKVTIEKTGEQRLGNLRKGQLFQYGDGVYIKTGANKACVIHKSAGMMNEGESVPINDDTLVVTVAEAIFKLG